MVEEMLEKLQLIEESIHRIPMWLLHCWHECLCNYWGWGHRNVESMPYRWCFLALDLLRTIKETPIPNTIPLLKMHGCIYFGFSQIWVLEMNTKHSLNKLINTTQCPCLEVAPPLWHLPSLLETGRSQPQQEAPCRSQQPSPMDPSDVATAKEE